MQVSVVYDDADRDKGSRVLRADRKAMMEDLFDGAPDPYMDKMIKERKEFHIPEERCTSSGWRPLD